MQAIMLMMVMMSMILTKTFPFLVETQDKKKRSVLEVSMRYTPHENNGLFGLKRFSTTDFQVSLFIQVSFVTLQVV